MGNVILAAASASTGSTGGNYTFLIVIVVLFALMYFVMIRPQRNRQRQMMQMQRGVAPGARVRTTAGMYATVVSVEGDDVVLEVAPGVNVRYLRRAIMEVVSSDGLADLDDSADGQADAGEETAAEDGPAGTADVTADAGDKSAADGQSAN